MNTPKKLLVIAGPCVLEGWDTTAEVAELLAALASDSDLDDVDFYFKASFQKDNRTRGDSYRGPGLEQGLDVLARVGREFGLKLTTDIHEPSQAAPVAGIVDLLQIPAFLCRQTRLIEAAAAMGRPLHIKKGQWASPVDMVAAVEKATAAPAVYVGERGTFFGYDLLVNDFVGVCDLLADGIPVIYDATHSLRWRIEGHDIACLAERMAGAALVVGVSGLFFEVHPQPDRSRSDPETQIPLERFPELLRRMVWIWRMLQERDPDV